MSKYFLVNIYGRILELNFVHNVHAVRCKVFRIVSLRLLLSLVVHFGVSSFCCYCYKCPFTPLGCIEDTFSYQR
jgi:hypothetical protein